MKILLLLLLLPVATFAQSDQPKIGTLADIKGLSKFYVVGDTADREKIIDELKKLTAITPVNDPAEAEFFIEYKTLSTQTMGLLLIATGQFDVYLMRDGKKVLAWSKGGSGGAYKGVLVGRLTGNFRGDLKKLLAGK